MKSDENSLCEVLRKPLMHIRKREDQTSLDPWSLNKLSSHCLKIPDSNPRGSHTCVSTHRDIKHQLIFHIQYK